jgi:hypothetical protein
MAVCPDTNIQCLNDTTWQQSAQIATTMTFYTRTADTFYSRSNGTLLGIADVSQARSVTILSADLFLVLDRFFNVPDESGNQSTTTQDFIRWVNTYINAYLLTTSAGELLDTENFLRSLLTLPLLWFQANGESNTLAPHSDSLTPNLPSNLYVTASLSESQSRIVIAQWTTIVFMSIGLAIYAWCIAWLTWAMKIQGPNISFFPLLDFASRVASSESPLGEDFARLASTSQNSDIKEQLQDVRIYLRVTRRGSVDPQARSDEGLAKIGFSTSAAGRLKRGVNYY